MAADDGTAWRFDLDHVCAEVGEQLADLSANPVGRQIDHSQSCEGCHQYPLWTRAGTNLRKADPTGNGVLISSLRVGA